MFVVVALLPKVPTAPEMEKPVPLPPVEAVLPWQLTAVMMGAVTVPSMSTPQLLAPVLAPVQVSKRIRLLGALRLPVEVTRAPLLPVPVVPPTPFKVMLPVKLVSGAAILIPS
jgi:hypothetical protein